MQHHVHDLFERAHLDRNGFWDVAAVFLALLAIGSATYFLTLALQRL